MKAVNPVVLHVSQGYIIGQLPPVRVSKCRLLTSFDSLGEELPNIVVYNIFRDIHRPLDFLSGLTFGLLSIIANLGLHSKRRVSRYKEQIRYTLTAACMGRSTLFSSFDVHIIFKLCAPPKIGCSSKGL